jgi:HPt (histidine-containing phosphotransfer) domain-containing protein
VSDFDLLQKQIYEVIESNLMNMDESAVISDLKRVHQNLSAFMKQAIVAYEEERDQRMRA